MKSEDIALSTCTVADNQTGFVFYDLARGRVIPELTDYCLRLRTKEQYDDKTVSGVAYNLRRFWNFSAQVDANSGYRNDDEHLENFNSGYRYDDEHLENFKQHELVEVMSSPLARGDEMKAMRTVNARMIHVYMWLSWLRDAKISDSKLIGATGARVTSALPVRPLVGRRAVRRKDSQLGDLFPLLFRGTGARSKHAISAWPTEKIRHDLVELLHSEACTAHVAHRNSLLVESANATGMRRGALNSLTTDQFTRAAVTADDEWAISIVAKRQKFKRSSAVDFPRWLALRFYTFISTTRASLLAEKGWTEKRCKGRVFLSETTGKPLTDGAITKLMSKAMRKLGMPAGSAIHRFRGKYATDSIEQRTAYRAARKMDTSAATIAADVSLSLGHEDPRSLFAYVSYVQGAGARKEGTAKDRYIQELEDENKRLRGGQDEAKPAS